MNIETFVIQFPLAIVINNTRRDCSSINTEKSAPDYLGSVACLGENFETGRRGVGGGEHNGPGDRGRAGCAGGTRFKVSTRRETHFNGHRRNFSIRVISALSRSLLFGSGLLVEELRELKSAYNYTVFCFYFLSCGTEKHFSKVSEYVAPLILDNNVT